MFNAKNSLSNFHISKSWQQANRNHHLLLQIVFAIKVFSTGFNETTTKANQLYHTEDAIKYMKINKSFSSK